MQSTIEIVVPEVSLPDTTVLTSKKDSLTALEIIEDTSKAGQVLCEPCAITLACVGGTACCLLMCVLQAKENDRKATRHDVVYAPNIRKNQAAEREAAGNLGVITGAFIPRALGRGLGGLVGLFRAPLLLKTGNPQASDRICGLSRETVDDVPSLCGGVTF